MDALAHTHTLAHAHNTLVNEHETDSLGMVVATAVVVVVGFTLMRSDIIRQRESLM